MTGVFIDVSNVYRHLRPDRLNYTKLVAFLVTRYGNIASQRAYLVDWKCPEGFKRALLSHGFKLETTTDTSFNWNLQLTLDVIDWSAEGDHAIIISNDPAIAGLINWFRINMPKFQITVMGSNLSEDVETLAADYLYLEKDLML